MNNGYENNLKPVVRRFYIAAALLLAIAIVSVAQTRNRKLLEMTLREVTRTEGGVSRIKEATANRRQALEAIKSQLDHNARSSSPEMVLYRKYDEIKARLTPDEMSMTALEKKGGEASLQFTLTFNNPDFNTLLNTVSGLHGSTFPMTPVSAITVAQANGKGSCGVTYKVTGKIITDDKAKP